MSVDIRSRVDGEVEPVDAAQCLGEMLPGAFEAHRQDAADPRRLARQIHDDIGTRAARQLRRPSPARGVDEHGFGLADESLVDLELDVALERLQCHDSPCLLLLGHVVRHAFPG